MICEYVYTRFGFMKRDEGMCVFVGVCGVIARCTDSNILGVLFDYNSSSTAYITKYPVTSPYGVMGGYYYGRIGVKF